MAKSHLKDALESVEVSGSASVKSARRAGPVVSEAESDMLDVDGSSADAILERQMAESNKSLIELMTPRTPFTISTCQPRFVICCIQS